ncbi:MAG: hypothetical protein E7004_04890 [Alphaproteobacteria bacterium]|nr:hypothetical protein [Alphaproteobacteria bacterium]
MPSPNDISEVYKNALSTRQNSDFGEVIAFCEKNQKCQKDNSLKKNMMLFWSYKKIALFYEKSKNYEKAYLFWQKVNKLQIKPELRVKVGHKLLRLVNDMKMPIDKKAGEIVKIAGYMQKAYKELGNVKSIERIAKLQSVAEKLLKKSKYLH